MWKRRSSNSRLTTRVRLCGIFREAFAVPIRANHVFLLLICVVVWGTQRPISGQEYQWWEGTVKAGDGATWNWFNQAAKQRWLKPLGDWFDRDGQLHGAKPFAEFRVNGTGPVAIDVTGLVTAWHQGSIPNQGFFLNAQGGTLYFASREHADIASRPRLTIQTNTGNIEAPCEADTSLTQSTSIGIGDRDLLRASNDASALLRFSLSGLSEKQTISRAILTLNCVKRSYKEQTVSLFRAAPGAIYARVEKSIPKTLPPSKNILLQESFEAEDWQSNWTSVGGHFTILKPDVEAAGSFPLWTLGLLSIIALSGLVYIAPGFRVQLVSFIGSAAFLATLLLVMNARQGGTRLSHVEVVASGVGVAAAYLFLAIPIWVASRAIWWKVRSPKLTQRLTIGTIHGIVICLFLGGLALLGTELLDQRSDHQRAQIMRVMRPIGQRFGVEGGIPQAELTHFQPLKGNALCCWLPEGGQTGLNVSWATKTASETEYEELYFRYYLRFGESWNPKIGGKLPGMAGRYGKAGWGGRTADGTNGWSARGAFEAIVPEGNPMAGCTPVATYCYHTDQRTMYGDVLQWDRSPLACMEKHRWYCIEQNIRLNDPDTNNGVLEVWIDDELAYKKDDLRFRTTGDLRIEEVWLNLFYGGQANSPANQYLFIDEVVVSTERIGLELP